MLVLDANAAISLAMREPSSLSCRELFYDGEKVIAPSLIHAELVHAFLKYVRGGYLDRMEANAKLNRALNLIDELIPMEEMTAEVFNESLRLGHSSYDIYYFVLARRTGATLLTNDKKLNKLCIQNGVDCFFKTEIEDDPMGGGEWTVRVSNIDGKDVMRSED